MLVSLHPKVELMFRRNGDAVFKAEKAFAVPNCDQNMRDFLLSIRRGLNESLFQKKSEEPALRALVQFLEKQSWIVRAVENPYVDLAQEKLFLYLQAQGAVDPVASLDRLRKSLVVILGCGGTGSAVAAHLLAMGVRRFILIDRDRVQASNLNRQLCFGESDFGKEKTQALSDYLRERAADVEVRCYSEWIEDEARLVEILDQTRPNFVVCGADQPPLFCHQRVAAACRKSLTPCLFGGVGLNDGSWGPLLITDAHFDAFAVYLKRIEDNFDADSFLTIGASLSSTNMFVATAMAHDIFAHLTDLHPPRSGGKKVRIRFPSLEISETEIGAAR